MGLGVGIVGLPNVGKSTTFNALTKAQNAEAQNYPFCTIEPNKAVVPVPDKRLDNLAKIVNPDKIQVLAVKRNFQLLATCPLDSTCEKPIQRKVKNFLRST